MNIQSESLDLSSLPPEARRELLDFYEFLRSKYGKADDSDQSEGNGLSAFLDESIQVDRIIPYTREELHERR